MCQMFIRFVFCFYRLVPAERTFYIAFYLRCPSVSFYRRRVNESIVGKKINKRRVDKFPFKVIHNCILWWISFLCYRNNPAFVNDESSVLYKCFWIFLNIGINKCINRIGVKRCPVCWKRRLG